MQRGLWRDCRRHAMLRRMQDDAQEKTKTAKRRGPKKATPKYLERVALWYLDRWAGSSGNLRRILMKRVEASARAHETDREEGQRSVEAIITRLRDTGLLNDRLVAESKARSQFAKGQPLGAIARKLHQQGLEDEDIAAALDGLREARAAPDLEAAITFARRRRLGPFRPEQERPDRRERDLAALGRRGFDYGTARSVIDADDPEALEDLLTAAREDGF